MLYRALAFLVVGFWLTMIGLLIRKEAGPRDSALREVPVGHIVKLLLHHQERSDLNIYREKLRLGHLSVRPHLRKEDRSRVIEFSGSLQIVIPGIDSQRVTWDGEMELEKTLATRRFTMGLTFHDPKIRDALSYRVQITVIPAENLLTWTLRSGDLLLGPPRTYTLDDAGLQTALRDIDPAMPAMIQGHTRSMAAPTVKALQSSMLIHGERIDTYLVSVEQSGQTLLAFHVDQLGHILHATTLIGYSLAPEDLMP